MAGSRRLLLTPRDLDLLRTLSLCVRMLGLPQIGRTWWAGNFTNTSFRVRVIDVAGNTGRDFFLDYLAVNVTYQP